MTMGGGRKRKRGRGEEEDGVWMPAFWHSPSSSNSAVMDLERRVRVVLGALLGGGGAVEKRHGVEEELKGEGNPLALRLRALLASSRRLLHLVFATATWLGSDVADVSHLDCAFFRLRWKLNFFMFCSFGSLSSGNSFSRSPRNFSFLLFVLCEFLLL